MRTKTQVTIAAIIMVIMVFKVFASTVNAGVSSMGYCSDSSAQTVVGKHNLSQHHKCGHIHHDSSCEEAGSCNQCGGSGKCHVCGGSGKINDHDCSVCNGSGNCHYCNGDGELWD